MKLLKAFGIFLLYTGAILSVVFAIGQSIKLKEQYHQMECQLQIDQLDAVCSADAWQRQERIFKWEICSGFDQCWYCIMDTADDNTFGNIEYCFDVHCDAITGGGCSGLLDTMLQSYFSGGRALPMENANTEHLNRKLKNG